MQTTSNGKITLKELCDITFPAFDLIDIKKVFNCYSSKKRIKKAELNKPGLDSFEDFYCADDSQILCDNSSTLLYVIFSGICPSSFSSAMAPNTHLLN